jgi:uncharacterized membrane protein YjfL (UPF0719 family)
VAYFFILPGFVLYVLAVVAAIIVTRLYAPAAPLRPYLISILGWSTLGFVVATIAYAGVMFLSLLIAGQSMGGPSAVGGIFLGLVVFVGPFLASGLGLVGGAVLGITRRRRQRLAS